MKMDFDFKTQSLLPTLLFVATFTYLVLKTIFTPLFGDEAATFYFYAVPFEFFPFSAHPDANNHVLNSFLTSISYHLFGADKFFLRLPSLLFFVLYFIVSLKISRLIRDRVLGLALFLALILSHNLIEFFTLTRGYGMAIALLATSIYFLIQYFETKKSGFLILVLITSSLSVLANLTLLVSFLIIGFLLLLFIFNEKGKGKNFIIWLILWVLPFLFFVKVALFFQSLNLLYYGNLSGFWNVTVKSVLALVFDQYHLILGITFSFFALIIGALYLTTSIKNSIWQFLFSRKNIFAHLFIGNIAAFLIMGYVLKINFPEDRVGLHLYFLFLPALFLLVDQIKPQTLKYLKYSLYLAFLIPLHFAFSTKIDYAGCYKDDYLPERFYHKLAHEQIDGRMATIGSYRTRSMMWQFMNHRLQKDMPYHFWTQFPDTICDYVIAHRSEKAFYSTGYDSIDYEPVNGRYLLKRKSFLHRDLISVIESQESNQPFVAEYFPLFEILGDSLNNETLVAEFEIELSANSHINETWLVISTNDSLGNVGNYEYAPINRAFSKPSKNIFKTAMIVYQIPSKTNRKVAYIWNPSGEEFIIHKYQIRVFRLSE